MIQGEAEFLGRTHAYPMVKTDPTDPRTPVLQWYPIKKGDQDGGELLAAFELLLVSSFPFHLPQQINKKYHILPNEHLHTHESGFIGSNCVLHKIGRTLCL